MLNITVFKISGRVRFQVFMAANMKITVCWDDVELYNHVEID
jgi:hypothetical protein